MNVMKLPYDMPSQVFDRTLEFDKDEDGRGI
jgi:hypothetical protein